MEQNPNIVDECTFNDYCHAFTLAQVHDLDPDSDECNEICTQSQLLTNGMKHLYNINLVTAIIEIMAFVIEGLTILVWNITVRHKVNIFYGLLVLQLILSFIDIPLEIASGSIIIDYDIINSLDVVDENQSFTRLSDSSITGMAGDVTQALYFSWIEAVFSTAMFIVGVKKLKKWKENIDNQEDMDKWVIGCSVVIALFNVIFAALTFFAFTMPAYNDYLELYDSMTTSEEQPIMSCWIKYGQ